MPNFLASDIVETVHLVSYNIITFSYSFRDGDEGLSRRVVENENENNMVKIECRLILIISMQEVNVFDLF